MSDRPPLRAIGDDDPTPPTWFSYSTFRDECARIAERLEHIALMSAKRIDLLDLSKAAKCNRIARDLRRLGAAFGRWEEMPEEDVARERAPLVAELKRQTMEAIAIMESMPTHATLGPVRRR